MQVRQELERQIGVLEEESTANKDIGSAHVETDNLAEELDKCEYKAFSGTDTEKITALRDRCLELSYYQKPIKPMPQRKSDETVPFFDCYFAPCQGGCPIHQDIPEYIRLVEKGKYKEALGVITEKNPLPFITGTICSHRCMTKCTRNFYEESVDIRGCKLIAAEKGYDAYIKELDEKKSLHRASSVPLPLDKGGKTAVIGAGAAGLSAAYFLARAGIQADVFEKDEKAGGIVRSIIPSFRIADEVIDKDVALIEKMGAALHLNTPAPSLEELRSRGYENVIFAVGAYKAPDPRVTGNVINVIDFLRNLKSGKYKAVGDADKDTIPQSACADSSLSQREPLGKNVVIIGGGNTAMDAARAAKRIEGVEKVSIVYRRTKKYMPADEEELKEALTEGVVFEELLAPVSQADGKLLCNVMKLGEPDASGRRSPVSTGAMTFVDADTVIAAIGERVDPLVFAKNNIPIDERGRAPFVTDCDGIKVYNIGDSLRGPCTVVECIADAQKAADDIIGASYTPDISVEAFSSPEEAIEKKGVLLKKADRSEECSGCLSCSTVCENCVDVCPNRANTVVTLPDGRREILHIDRLCNECGNCKTFCPYASAPYKDKLTLFMDIDGFNDSENKGFVPLGENKVRVRLDSVFDVDLNGKNDLSKDMELFILTVLENFK